MERSTLSSVSFVPASSRPGYDPSLPEDQVCLLSVGPTFKYVIPSFEVLQVDLQQARVKGYDSYGKEIHYDFFIRSDIDLNRSYPAWLVIKEAVCVQVCIYQYNFYSTSS